MTRTRRLILASTLALGGLFARHAHAQTPPSFYYNCTGNFVLSPSGSGWVCVTIPSFQQSVAPGAVGTTCPSTSGVVGCSVQTIGGRVSYIPYY